jgi:hypothetical protein
MRRWLGLAILMAVYICGVITGENAGASPHRPAAKICTQKAKSQDGVKALIKCVAPKLGVSTSYALYIAYRESRYNPYVCNSSDHCGVYQDARAIWNYEVSNYVYGHLLGNLSRINGRANVILNLRYVSHHGWGPWGG